MFDLTAEEVEKTKYNDYRSDDYVACNVELRTALGLTSSGYFFPHGNLEVFCPLTDNLTLPDTLLMLADYAAYFACQNR